VERVVNGAEPLSMRVVRRWTLLYTRGLPAEARERRCLELESDMWEHLHDASEPDAVREVVGRFMRGIPADVRWRYRTLLDSRGARQRSQEMTMSLRSNWWVILTAVLGAAIPAMSLAMAVVGPGVAENPFLLIGVATSLVTGGLMLGGLVRRQTDLTSGSQLIFAGALLTLVAGLEFIPVGLIVLISGFWTGNLQLSETQDTPDLFPVRQQQVDMTHHWFVWLGAAAVLFAVGWIPLIIEGDDLTWGFFIWALSWLGAIVIGGVGVILTGLRFVVRHRTRLA
jgi:hypothetical protein